MNSRLGFFVDSKSRIPVRPTHSMQIDYENFTQSHCFLQLISFLWSYHLTRKNARQKENFSNSNAFSLVFYSLPSQILKKSFSDENCQAKHETISMRG